MKSVIHSSKLRPLVFPLLFVMCFVLTCWPAFQRLFSRWEMGDNSYCYLIVPLFLYLCWEKHDSFKFPEFSWSSLGLFPVALSLLLLVAGEMGSIETFLLIGIWGCFVGLIFTLYGWRIRYLIFPIMILFFIVPLPPFLNEVLTFRFKMAASTLSVEMLRAVGVSVMREGNIIDLGIEQLQVVDACSGLRYFMPMILMALLVGYFFNKGWWQKAILIFLVVPLSIFVNGIRIFATALLTVKGHKGLVQGFSHDFEGWLMFMIAGALLVSAAFLLKKFGHKKPKDPLADLGGRSVSPAMSYILTVMICVLFAGSGWALHKNSSSRNVPDRKAFDSFPMEIAEWKGERSYLSEAIQKSLWADDYISATYKRKGLFNQIRLFISFYDYQGTRHAAHAPQSCLLGSGWSLIRSDDHLTEVAPNHDIKMRTMALVKDNARLLSAYFFFQRGRVITSPWANKFYIVLDSLGKGRTDGSLVRIEMAVAPGQSIEDTYEVLDEFASKVWLILPDYVPK